MSVDPKLLDLLACPETKQSVQLAQADLLERLNNRITSGQLKNRSQAVVHERIDAGLLREDKQILYPIRDGIPLMLVEEGIELTQL